MQVNEYLGVGAAVVVVDAVELLHAKAAWATHAANQLMADVGPQRLLFDADSDAKVRCAHDCQLRVSLSSSSMLDAVDLEWHCISRC
jgi:hypothetical protein